MSGHTYALVVIALAFLAANFPFLTNRLMGVVRLPGARKPFWVRLIELAVMYFAVGAAAVGIESQQGQVYSQGWEFYAITLAMFLTFAFPGFVFRYLARRG